MASKLSSLGLPRAATGMVATAVLLAAAAHAEPPRLPGTAAATGSKQTADSASVGFELISVARFGDRAVATIALPDQPGSRRVIRLGSPVGNSGYVLSLVDADFVELKKGESVITLTLDKADEASIARRRAAREAREAARKAAENQPRPGTEKKRDSEAITALRDRLSLRLPSWEFADATPADVLQSLRKWTGGAGGEVSFHLHINPAFDLPPISASGSDNSIQDILNLLSKDFQIAYSATPAGDIVLGAGYRFKSVTVQEGDTIATLAERYETPANLIATFNPGSPEAGKRFIIPVPLEP